MKPPASRFGALAQAVRDRTASTEAAPARPAMPEGAGVHKPAAALSLAAEGLRDRVARLEGELARASSANAGLERALAHAREAAGRAGDSVEEFLFLDASLIEDPLPRDRLPGAFEGPEFLALLEDIRQNGQNDAITVRRRQDGLYEIAAGRRRLEACRRLGIAVLARIRALNDPAMLRVQFSENERREDISALERARWFAEVRSRLEGPARDIAAQFGLDPSTFSLYLRLSRFPSEIIERLAEPRRLAVLRARRVMEAIEANPDTLSRILEALDAYRRQPQPGFDPDEQIAVLMRAAEGRAARQVAAQPTQPERRHIVHEGRRIGTLTRNGGQWVFRFATSLPDETVQAMADRLPELVGGPQKPRRGGG
ncbi:chromosome partitioning protein ParB [Pseudoroseomonas rhizosphaerae]|uniref:Chromosome partitioning protein ParB n=1 Tax=Teichococcus rhizosphaerae TaxID=1335062 RepID=A0A2C7ACW0_9PROT|nr:ParB/RepB/Spo0J family partition protein [Pseudoroseomonas rhizosphaerae]PHK95275.1 chromosome partitioning protein ParB [Pseudoroseomonas rhizosphaerae]